MEPVQGKEKQHEEEKDKDQELKSDDFKVQTYTQKELAARYHISTRTLRRYVKSWNIGERFGSLYTPKQVKFIMEKMGKPFMILIGVFAGIEFGHKDK